MLKWLLTVLVVASIVAFALPRKDWRISIGGTVVLSLLAWLLMRVL
jgi:FtsH-binding integral membrane protein